MRLRKLIQFGRQILDANEIYKSKQESLLLYSKINNFELLDFYKNNEIVVPEEKRKKFLKKIYLRACGKPFSKIIGKKEFYSRVFYTNSQTLDPRPDSELIVDSVKKLMLKNKKQKSILDLGTGSGCLIISILLELKKHQIIEATGIDINANSIVVAKKNLKLHKLEEHISFFRSNWFQNVNRKFDVIISNPPYIISDEIKDLSKTIIDYEPNIAIDGGNDGLNAYREIARSIKPYLNFNGCVVLEIGFNQKKKVEEIFKENGFVLHFFSKDLGGKDRVMIFKNKI